MTDPVPARARRLWPQYEVPHATVYFCQRHRAAMDAVGTKGGWMAYFASRSAPLGEPGPALVTATFFGFAPAMVARAIPDAWRLTPGSPAVLEARLTAVTEELSESLGDTVTDPRFIATAEKLWDVAQAAPTLARPLAAANQDLPRPENPVSRFWQACTILREHRGDGHIVALTSHGIDAPTSHVLKVGIEKGLPGEFIRQNRGFTEEEWSSAVDAAQSRGWIDDNINITAAGRETVTAYEALTDTLAAEAWRGVPEDLDRDLSWVTQQIVAGDAMPFPNPIGLPRPEVIT